MKKIPNLRFKNNPLKLVQLGDLVQPVIREVSKPNSSYKRLSIRSHAKGTFHNFVDDPKTIGMDKLYLVKENDLIVNITFAWEHAIAIAKQEDDGLLVSHRFPTYTLTNVDKNFLEIYIKQSRFKKYLDDISPGGAGRNRVMNKKDFLKIPLTIPEKSEQQSIGSLFHTLDDLLLSYKENLANYQAYKATMLSKMFPKEGEKEPEIRLDGFEGEWEKGLWKDEINISTNMVDPKNEMYSNLPHIAPGNIESFTGRILENVKFVKDENLISGKFKFSAGDVIYGKINPQLGKYFYASCEGLTSADAYVLNSKGHLDQRFIFCLIQTKQFFNYSVSVSRRTGMPKINRDELNSFKFQMPNIKEQYAIGKFFSNLDDIITSYQDKISELENLKKKLLKEMFI